MRKILTGGLALVLSAALSLGAFAMEVPTDSSVQNLNGVQQFIKTYTVSPDVAPEALIEDDFEYEGYRYSFADIVKQENYESGEKEQTETVTVNTEKKDTDKVLEALAPTVEYDDGKYSGTLSLDHTTIRTEAAGYETRWYTVSTTKEIDNLPSNDMSYVPETTVKDGVTINLASVDWQVQSTVLVDDLLVPASYKAVASYSGRAYYSAATGYVSTADYKGTVSYRELSDITYTVTYVGTPLMGEETAESITEQTPELEAAEPEAGEEISASRTLQEKDDTANMSWVVLAGGAVLCLLLGLALGLVFGAARQKKQNGAYEKVVGEMEDYRHE